MRDTVERSSSLPIKSASLLLDADSERAVQCDCRLEADYSGGQVHRFVHHLQPNVNE